MKKLSKFLFGTLLGVMMFGMTTFAAEYTVTPASAVFYTNENTIVLMDAAADAQVILPSCDSNLPIQVTGITSNGYWQISLAGQTYYIAGIGLSPTVTAENTTEKAAVTTPAPAPAQPSAPVSTGKYTCVIEAGDEELYKAKTPGNWGISTQRKDYTTNDIYILIRDQLETAYNCGKSDYEVEYGIQYAEMNSLLKNLCVDFIKVHPDVRMQIGANCPTASLKNPFMGTEYADYFIIFYK